MRKRATCSDDNDAFFVALLPLFSVLARFSHNNYIVKSAHALIVVSGRIVATFAILLISFKPEAGDGESLRGVLFFTTRP